MWRKMYTRHRGGFIMRRIQKIVALMAAGAVLYTGVSGFCAVVLCKGDNGHVQIEAATRGVCTSDEKRTSERSTSTEAVLTASRRGDHCGPCVDIPLKIGAGRKSSSLLGATRTEITVAVVTTALEMHAAPVSHVQRSMRDTRMASSTLLSLRAVTLLI